MDSVGAVLMPDVTHNTRTFESVLDAIEEKDIPIITAVSGDSFALGNAQVQVMAPCGTGYNNLNDYSVVLRVEFGNSTFLFTGDADSKSENEQLVSGLTLTADVLKVGHHGSRASSAQRYLNAVTPKYAVISCAQGNSYGHPHREVMQRLSGMDVEIYRTDENGTIIFTTDGETITVSVDRESAIETQPDANEYIGNKNSKAFHLATCASLPQEQNRVYFATREEAVVANFTPCRTCIR